MLDERVFCPSSPVFNPPDLFGLVSTRTALDAMIARSDNTATDMILNQVGHQRVQAFVDAIGLRATPIPSSLRQLVAYDAGFADWQTITWEQLTGESPTGSPHPILNDVITMASTPDDLVSFFSRALQGEFFRFPETLAVFRAILSTADAIAATMPLGVSAFGKGGSFALNQEYALSFAGGMYVPDRWVYFSLIINWTDAEAGPLTEVQPPFVAAGRTIFTLVRDRLRPRPLPAFLDATVRSRREGVATGGQRGDKQTPPRGPAAASWRCTGHWEPREPLPVARGGDQRRRLKSAPSAAEEPGGRGAALPLGRTRFPRGIEQPRSLTEHRDRLADDARDDALAGSIAAMRPASCPNRIGICSTSQPSTPSPPALLTAATNSGDECGGPMPPCTTGCGTPTRVHNGVVRDRSGGDGNRPAIPRPPPSKPGSRSTPLQTTRIGKPGQRRNDAGEGG